MKSLQSLLGVGPGVVVVAGAGVVVARGVVDDTGMVTGVVTSPSPDDMEMSEQARNVS